MKKFKWNGQIQLKLNDDEKRYVDKIYIFKSIFWYLADGKVMMLLTD